MVFNYNQILTEKLYELQNELGLGNFVFKVDSEQAFLKKKELLPKTIYVLTKELQNDNSISVETQPVQIMILSEQDSLDVAKAFFSEFAKRNNFIAISLQINDGNLWIKQQYSDPVVLSNFNTVNYGYRSVLYISATLYIMKDVLDIDNLKVDDKSIEALNVNISYSMSTNTQQLPKTLTENNYIAKSLKTVSTFALTMSVPILKNDLVVKVLRIIAEKNETGNTDIPAAERIEYNGNNPFKISFDFSIGKEQNAFKISMEQKQMRLVSAQIITAPNQVPSLQLGFMK